jgi:hypothetical protein
MAIMMGPFTGTNVLLLIRDKQATDLKSLCNAFKLSDYESFYIRAKIDQLLKAGIIVEREAGRYEVAESWPLERGRDNRREIRES